MKDLNAAMLRSTPTVLVLVVLLVALLVLLFFLYMKLNREANGEYTIQRLVYKKGGVRDRVRSAVLTLEAHLCFQLWPRNDDNIEDMDGEDDVERQEEGEDSQGSDPREEDDRENPENDSTDPSNTSEGKGDENSSVENLEVGEHGRLTVAADVTNETSENQEKKTEVEKKLGGEGTELLIDLKQFSGSAIWSEEEGVGDKGGDLTAL